MREGSSLAEEDTRAAGHRVAQVAAKVGHRAAGKLVVMLQDIGIGGRGQHPPAGKMEAFGRLVVAALAGRDWN
jgi:hypothetical protein